MLLQERQGDASSGLTSTVPAIPAAPRHADTPTDGRPPATPATPAARWPRVAVGALAALLLAATAVAFARLAAGPHYPTSDDAAGHLYKAVALLDSLRAGGGIPSLFPGWYAGVESFRYYPIVPYLLLLPALLVAGDDRGGAALLVLVAGLLASGAGVLLWRRSLGWPVAILGALLGAVLTDPLRVAFGEGNVPRVVAHTLLLPTVWMAAESARGRRAPAVLLPLLLALTVLSHAMIGATAAVAATLVLLAGAVAGRWSRRGALRASLLVGAGIALSGWWLVPSLSGGLTDIDPAAVRRALFHFPVWTAFDPVSGRATFYAGIALVGGALAALALRGRQGAGWPYLVAGLPLALAAVDPFALLYLHLPIANLLWPIRLASAGQALLLLGLLHVAAEGLARTRSAERGARNDEMPHPAAPARSIVLVPRSALRVPRLAALLLLACLVADALPGLAVVRAGSAPADQLAVAARLERVHGWREATLDLSRLGSSPTLLWLGREQLYGWGYQGARTAAEVADLNEAVERDLTGYLLDRLDWWGVDDVVFDRPHPDLEAALAGHGYTLRGVDGSLRHWGRDGGPRAVLLDRPTLGIGAGARSWAGRFPEIARGKSGFVDDYTLDELRGFDRVVLSRAQWHNRAAAEALVRRYAAGGGHVVIDLTGSPDDPLTRSPRFLGVYGERLPFPASGVVLDDGGTARRLAPFTEEPWMALMYEGVDHVAVSTSYTGETTNIIGTLDAGAGSIAFVGLNLAYHELLTGDPVAADLLARHTGLTPERGAAQRSLPLEGYRADGAGYRFALTLDTEQRVVVPVARHDGLTVTVDGAPWRADTLDDALVLALPAGRHEVAVAVSPGGNRRLGLAMTALGLALAGALLLRRSRSTGASGEGRRAKSEE